jgi:hypothetical protein
LLLRSVEKKLQRLYGTETAMLTERNMRMMFTAMLLWKLFKMFAAAFLPKRKKPTHLREDHKIKY